MESILLYLSEIKEPAENFLSEIHPQSTRTEWERKPSVYNSCCMTMQGEDSHQGVCGARAYGRAQSHAGKREWRFFYARGDMDRQHCLL